MPPSIDKLYQSYHSIVFSPDGNYLAISDRYGNIVVHKLSHLALQSLNSTSTLQKVTKLQPFVTISSELHTAFTAQLLTWRDFLLCCFPDGQVNAYLWSDISKQRSTVSLSKRFILSHGHASSVGYELETWASLTDPSGKELLLAGGCSMASDFGCSILSWDIESGKLLNSYRGHTDGVHRVSTSSKPSGTCQEFLSAGEGGEVRLWDLRSSTDSVAVMKPFETECARPEFGRWISCLLSDGDWMVCGGGPRLGLWHIGSRSLVKSMNASGSDSIEHNCGTVVEDRIITGGSGGNLFHWNYRGDLIAVVPTACDFVYDLKHETSNQKILAVVGSGHLIDLYSNLIYRLSPVETVL